MPVERIEMRRCHPGTRAVELLLAARSKAAMEGGVNWVAANRAKEVQAAQSLLIVLFEARGEIAESAEPHVHEAAAVAVTVSYGMLAQVTRAVAAQPTLTPTPARHNTRRNSIMRRSNPRARLPSSSHAIVPPRWLRRCGTSTPCVCGTGPGGKTPLASAASVPSGARLARPRLVMSWPRRGCRWMWTH